MKNPEDPIGISGLGEIGSNVFSRALQHRTRRDFSNRNIVINEFVPVSDTLDKIVRVVEGLGGVINKLSADRVSITVPQGAYARHTSAADADAADADAADADAADAEQKRVAHVKIFNWRDPKDLRWREEGVKTVIAAERDPEQNAKAHIETGRANEVLLAGPSAEYPEILRGVNEDKIVPAQKIYSHASCSTNAGGMVMAKILGAVRKGALPKLSDVVLGGSHAATNTDSAVDRPGTPGVLDNFVASKTGSTKALQRIFAEDLDGTSVRGGVIRSGVTEGSILTLDFVFEDAVKITREQLLSILREEEPTDRGIFGIDSSRIPDVRGSRKDLRPSVLLESLTDVGNRSVSVAARYNNVLASANEALLKAMIINLRRAFCLLDSDVLEGFIRDVIGNEIISR